MIAVLLACSQPDEPQRLLDTGWFEPATTATCADLVLSTLPEADETGWSWRAIPRVYTTTSTAASYTATLVDPAGVVLPVDLVWATDGGLYFDVVPPDPLLPSAAYLLAVTDCAGRVEVPFTTSSFGLPLAGGPASLVDRTWLVNLGDGTWLQPAAVGPLLSLYLTTPILLGVTGADGLTIELIGGPGEVDPLVGIEQDPRADTWEFPPAPFGDQPFFSATADQAVLSFEGLALPVEDFALSGTFAADGSSIGDLRVSGLGDTAGMGGLIGSDDPMAVCEFAEGLGVACEACKGGSVTCLRIDVADILAPEVLGLTLVPQ